MFVDVDDDVAFATMDDGAGVFVVEETLDAAVETAAAAAAVVVVVVPATDTTRAVALGVGT